MRSNGALLLAAVILCVGFCVLVEGLKCQTDDGPTEEDVKRVVRVCMRKIGEELDDNSNDYEDDEQPSDQDNYRSRNREHLRGRQGRYRRSGYKNSSNGYGQSNNNNNNNNNQSNYERRSEYDRSCLMHCFFQEMKMTNEDEFPDKHKVLHVLTRELRNRQLKNFYTDSIQECFHILEMEQRRDKCEFSRNLIYCLGERAKTNCDDWSDNTVIF
ncbi:general odorant-binding protein 71 [Phlebotomus argentipes]|uniref:general odorant-binding protein 71 n=1 Tax=Phlebotomus argentipes TaxID=94469 RepID=UPI0028936272|nr:general odorant-binding protein 71 [Phlebotomus argentipes]